MSRRNQKRKDRHFNEPTAPADGRGNDRQGPGPEGHASRIRSWPEPTDASHGEDEKHGAYSWREVVSNHPIAALVASFSVGLGIGVLAVAVLDHAGRSRRWPRSLHDWTANLESLPGKIAEHLPETRFWR